MSRERINEIGLLEASVRGDTAAFEALVRKYQSFICGITFSATGDIERSEELAQETFVSAWRDLVHLKDLTQLEVLFLSGPQLADAGLVHLKGLTQLKTLILGGTQVTGAGLVHLKGLTQLQEMWLNRTEVTDAGLEHLKGLTKLRSLHLRGTIVTGAGVAKLQKALPNCKIDH